MKSSITNKLEVVLREEWEYYMHLSAFLPCRLQIIDNVSK